MVTLKLVSACEAAGSEMIHWKLNAVTVHTFISQVMKIEIVAQLRQIPL